MKPRTRQQLQRLRTYCAHRHYREGYTLRETRWSRLFNRITQILAAMTH